MRGDEGKLRQVLMNLLGNAVKFTKTGGITLRARWRQEMAAFEVEDTGVGISEGDQKAIFEPFMQSQSGLNSRQGTGLGLSICRNFVQLMGGNLCVTSTEGQGSIFSFEVRLPATTEAEARPEERRVVGLLPGQPDYRIVVADDRWENRVVLVKLLASVGFNVREAVDGKETLEVSALLATALDLDGHAHAGHGWHGSYPNDPQLGNESVPAPTRTGPTRRLGGRTQTFPTAGTMHNYRSDRQCLRT